MADIEGATELAKRASDDQAARVMGRWLAECKQVIEDNDGTINKFLGDGFFAYWREDPNAANNVAAALGLKRFRMTMALIFILRLGNKGGAPHGATVPGRQGLARR